MGPVEEFLTNGMGLGYEEATPGESFVKIGVGAIRKPEETTFRQFETYDIADNGKWTIHKTSDSVEFTQDLTDLSMRGVQRMSAMNPGDGLTRFAFGES
jgi:hypothetical protein